MVYRGPVLKEKRKMNFASRRKIFQFDFDYFKNSLTSNRSWPDDTVLYPSTYSNAARASLKCVSHLTKIQCI